MCMLLSIDVGIKNLCYCLFHKIEGNDYYNIKKWDIIDLTETPHYYCLNKDKKNNICNNIAKYKKNNMYYCLKHSKKTEYIIPTIEISKNKINKLKINELKELANKYEINYESNINRKNLLTIINDYFYDKTLEPILKTNCKDIDMIIFGRNIKKHFDNILKDNFNDLNDVCIELQITSKMRILSYMLAQYFITNNNNIKIHMISPCYKLKNLEDEKTDYATRKKNSIKHCNNIIQEYKYNNWLVFFNQHKKKDDLADSFLQGLWFINNNLINNNIINNNIINNI